MEKEDLELIERYATRDVNLKKLYTEHVSFERRLEKLDRKPFLTATEEAERKELQKKKLLGRDHIERILITYRTKAPAP